MVKYNKVYDSIYGVLIMNIKDIQVNKLLNAGLEKGVDPDKYSKDLKDYHMCLWENRTLKSKPFKLESGYLNRMIFNDGEHEIVFTPDSITNISQNSKRKYKSKPESEIVKDYCNDISVKELVDRFNEIDYTIGSSIIYPISIDNKSIGWTLNRARGVLYKIHDRIDLTLECIRRYYNNEQSVNPLLSSIIKNKLFFDLFSGFKEYVDFFFLNDLVDVDYNVLPLFGSVCFDTPFPDSIEEYKIYVKNTISFVEKRNARIDRWVKEWK